MQPQFQWAQSKGAKTYESGDFSPNSNNRFMLRRGRFRIDYAHFNENQQPLALFAFQFDGTERGIAIRDFWGRFYENKLEIFALTAGMFARPMGFEVNYSSSDRESPERGRMSQILMRTERDLGVMLTFDMRKTQSWLKKIKFDIGVFNGQGLAGVTDYDSHKDLIGRLSLKPQTLKSNQWEISAAVSGYYGGISSQSQTLYRMQGKGSEGLFAADSTPSNKGYASPRKYIGADFQVKIPNLKGYTEFRGEYIRGLQTATAGTSETPGSYPFISTNVPAPLYIRHFDGAYFTFLQNITPSFLAIARFDWYDPNKKVKSKDLVPGKGLSQADIRYNTLGVGAMYFVNAHVKWTLYYSMIHNESTGLTDYTSDVKDNVFTCRLQYRF